MAIENAVPVDNRSLLRVMAKSGVPFGEARWFHLQAKSGGFKTAADVARVKSILFQVGAAVH